MTRKLMWIFLTAFALLTIYNVIVLRFNLFPLTNPILTPLTTLQTRCQHIQDRLPTFIDSSSRGRITTAMDDK